ncbi:type II toxin-antitoxin system RelB/DinJ family antitoxin [Enterococcus faecium]|uniref:type II toxin-antitoxin system RelB/DinJ family antitoxin n=1 Tax=Enterococcus faecium TaxID=1352 RepID=UPI0034E96C48
MAKLQISMDGKLKNEAESIIDELGMSPKTAVTVFYKQIVEQGKIPFSIELSEKSKRIHNIQRLAEKLPVQKLDTDEKIEEWFNEDEY